MLTVSDITAAIEEFAPLSYQESYDNAGLIVGRPNDTVTKALVAVDLTDEVLAEAVEHRCDMIITHHPIIFHAIKRLNSASIVERCVEGAIRHGIAIYGCHTNLDSTPNGMSWRLAAQLGVEQLELLQPTHPNQEWVGFGVVGNLAEPIDTIEYLKKVKAELNIGSLRHSAISHPTISRVALCTGAGGSLIEAAQSRGAELYLTADLKYNDFFTPDNRLVVADIGHFESEFCAISILCEVISKKITNFALRASVNCCNPVHYLY